VRLVEPDAFRSFSVVLDQDVDARLLDAALRRVGRPDGDGHVFVDLEKLRALAGDRALDPSWQANLDAMGAVARKNGWLDRAGRVRAHLERTKPS